MRSRLLLLAGCLLPVLPVAVYGQLDPSGDATEAVEEIPQYTVEMVVFEYANSALAGNERFIADEPLPEEQQESGVPLRFGDPGTSVDPMLPEAIEDPDSAVDLPDLMHTDSIDLDEELEELPSHIIQTQLEVLDPEQFAMPEIYKKLVERGEFRPIMRAAWNQATYEKEQSLPIKLRRLGNAPLRLDGTVLLYRSRYLRFVVDLTIESREQRTVDRYDDSTRYYGDRWSSSRYGFGYDTETVPIRYTISNDQIFRNGELRYYDHPKFGVLVRVTRIEEEMPETDEMFLLPGDSATTPSSANP
ncbi:MAG: CsiV family protein [Woeseiaceae bacterium]|nr:CsiV family protein [Woeseiaceae bacterium]